MIILLDGSGSGYAAKVDKFNKIWTYAESGSHQHFVSERDGQAYQVIGEANLAAATVVSLHVTNNSPTQRMVVTYIRHQIVDQSGGTAIPNASNYFRVALGRTYSSGGSAATPVNANEGSSNSADVTAYEGAPTLAGTAKEIDRWHTQAEGDMNRFNKEGAVIIEQGKSIELAYVGDQTSGIIYSRLSFFMEEIR